MCNHCSSDAHVESHQPRIPDDAQRPRSWCAPPSTTGSRWSPTAWCCRCGPV